MLHSLVPLVVPMESIFTKLDTLTGQGVNSTQKIAALIAVIFFCIVSAKSSFRASTMVITFIVCGFFVWGVGHMQVGSTTVNDTVNTGANGQP